MNKSLRRSRVSGFSLVELLVVIGIIGILIGLLLPALIRGKQSAYMADTKNEISNLTAAIGNYQAVFNAYPGPFTNDQIEQPTWNSTLKLGIQFEVYNPLAPSPTYVPPAAPMPVGYWHVSGAENLAVGLLGGLRIDTGNNNALAYAPGDVGLGPMSLNSLNPKRYPPFIQMNSGSTNIVYAKTDQNKATGMVNDPNGGKFTDGLAVANDSPLPKFIDRFPTQLPILYLRARVGAQGVVSYIGSPTATLATDPPHQYDIGDVISYTGSKIGSINTEKGISTPTHGLVGIYPLFPVKVSAGQAPPYVPPGGVADGSGTPVNNGQNAGAYFINPSVVPTDSMDFETGQPHAVDEYILISAGPDGIYGTLDDITSFGDIMK